VSEGGTEPLLNDEQQKPGICASFELDSNVTVPIFEFPNDPIAKLSTDREIQINFNTEFEEQRVGNYFISHLDSNTI
jgi:hypothetical protein